MIKNSPLTYFFSHEDNENITYSIDRITIKFNIKIKNFNTLINFLKRHPNRKPIEYDVRPFHYRYLVPIDYGHSTMIVCLYLNQKSGFQGKITVNPNKCFTNTCCINELLYILTLCRSWSVSEIDFAMDIPEEKSIIHMKNHHKKKVSYYNSGRKKLSKDIKERFANMINKELNLETEYLGERNRKTKDGYCKLYNKSLECDTNGKTITRFEMTIVLDKNLINNPNLIVEKLKIKMPNLFVKINNDIQIIDKNFYKKYEVQIKSLAINDNPYNVLRGINYNGRSMSKYLKEKLFEYLNIKYISPNPDSSLKLFNDLCSFINSLKAKNSEEVMEVVNPRHLENKIEVGVRPVSYPNKRFYKLPLIC